MKTLWHFHWFGLGLIGLVVSLGTGCGEDTDDAEEVVGEITVALDCNKNVVRTGEALAGNFVADAVLSQATDVDIVMVNGGNLRYDKELRTDGVIPAGDVTPTGVAELLPFENTVSYVTLTGAQVRRVLEHGVNAFNDASAATEDEWEGWFMQVAGMTYVADTSKQREVYNGEADPPEVTTEGERIIEATVGGQPLDDAATYRVATSKFLADGLDGHLAFTEGTDRVDSDTLETQIVIDYLKASSPVTPALDGRIEIR